MTFDRVVCGVDGSPAGLEALRQGALLREPAGSLVAITVCEWTVAVRTGFHAAQWADELRQDAERASEEARREIEGIARAETRVVEGRPIPALLTAVRQERATLLAVGTHGLSRPEGALLGSVASTLLHDAPCPVLVARPARKGRWSPRTIVVGVDGSAESIEAAACARMIADRFGASLRSIVARGGKSLDDERLHGIGGFEWSDLHPVKALVTESHAADLVVVGSRGLHGLRALGSVSERVAHQATCSVLVVRKQEVE